jgi:membrane-bound lytic murein transglycosylase D
MNTLNSLSKLITLGSLLLLSACSTQLAKNTVDPSSPSESSVANLPSETTSAWEEAYGEPQDLIENEIDDASPEIDYSKFKQANKNKTPVRVTDVWQRIRNGYGIEVSELHNDTQTQLNWFITHPDYVDRVVERARPYLHYIVTELEKRDMPLELALLPIVESGFQPNAVSSSGAAGIWQFIPGTGKVYGLEQNWWYDGRRDVIRSTQAAIRYLQKLHNDFNDWQLALAAYNCGEGTVGRAIKRNIAAGKPTDFWSLDLPRETSAYVPKLLAVAHLVKYPERYDISLSPIANESYLQTVKTHSQIEIALAAKLAGLTPDELYQLNPGYNQFATSPDGPHQLVLPKNKAQAFSAALAKLPKENRVRWTRHKIKSGESLGKIAQKYNTTVLALKQANGMKNNFLRAGKNLLIPVGRTDSNQMVASSSTNRVSVTKQSQQLHIVQSGDTWWDIAKNYDIDVASLTTWNKKSPSDVLQPGQKLIIWSTSTSSDSKSKVTYTIQPGDTLWKISRLHNVSVDELREWNGLNSRSLLTPGQNLTLYVNSDQKTGKI